LTNLKNFINLKNLTNLKNLANYHIVLASNSPRRRELLAGLGLQFEVSVVTGIDESYPETLPVEQIAEFIAEKKSKAYPLASDELLITADTIVVAQDEVLGKPKDADDARRMLRMLSGRTHHVITGVCLATQTRRSRFSSVTEVTFSSLTDEEIEYYIREYRPFDKAGSYGIQEWIGYVGVEGIRGSFYNVMGLPVQRIYQELKKF